MDFRVGDVVTTCGKYPMVVTGLPENSGSGSYSFLYYDGMVDEEYRADMTEEFKLVGHIDGVEALLAKIAEFSNG